MSEILSTIESLGIHRGGWIVVSALLIIPALVSVRTIQFLISEVLQRRLDWRKAVKPLLGNLLIACISIAVIGNTIVLYS